MTAPHPRDALLERVIEHFVDHGVGDTSLRTLAAEVGTSHRMLLYHFGSREGLLAAVVAQIGQAQRDTLIELADASPDDPRGGAWHYWELLADHSATVPLVFELSARAMHDAPWRESFVEGNRAMVDHVTQRLVRFGEPSKRARVLARMCVSIMLGALWELRLTGDRRAADATVRAFLDATWPA